jgi:hypothetical protein
VNCVIHEDDKEYAPSSNNVTNSSNNLNRIDSNVAAGTHNQSNSQSSSIQMGTIKSRNQRSRNPSNSVGPNRSGLIGSSQDPHNQKSSNDKTLNQDFSCSISETNEEDSDDDEEESKEDGGEGKKSII